MECKKEPVLNNISKEEQEAREKKRSNFVCKIITNFLPKSRKSYEVFDLQRAIMENVMDIDDPKTLICIWAWIMKNKALNEWDK